MVNIQNLIALLQTEKACFKLVKSESDKVLEAMDAASCLLLAKGMYESDVYQARMFAVLIFGKLAAEHKEALGAFRSWGHRYRLYEVRDGTG